MSTMKDLQDPVYLVTRGYTVAQASEATGFSHTYIRKKLRAKLEVYERHAARIREALNLETKG